MLYRTAKKREPVHPPLPEQNAQELAKELIVYYHEGKYRADNPGDLRDLEATAAGKAVWSQAGRYVHVDRRPLATLVWLIRQGYKIGTFAICSDHHYDGPHA